jgi:hypothetical protein
MLAAVAAQLILEGRQVGVELVEVAQDRLLAALFPAQEQQTQAVAVAAQNAMRT